MKIKIYLGGLLVLIMAFFCSCKGGGSASEETDPIKFIEALSQQASENESTWSEKEWGEAAEQLQNALAELPSPLEQDEEIQLTQAITTLEVISGMHKRKAALMIDALEDYKNKGKAKNKTKNNDKYADNEETGGDDEFYGESSGSPVPNNCELEGLIENKYKVTMHLVRSGGDLITGNYYYNKYGPKNKLQVNGTVDGSHVVLSEYNSDMQETGHFDGVFSDGSYTGTFNTPNGRPMPFSLQSNTTGGGFAGPPVNATGGGSHGSPTDNDYAADKSSVEDAIADYLNSSNDLDIDVDEWLDSYDKLLDEAIKWYDGYKRMEPVAVQKYTEILNKSVYYTKTGGRVGVFLYRSGTASQLNKFTKISQKAAKLFDAEIKKMK